MDDYALVLNAGSSSLKFSVYRRPQAAPWAPETRGQIDGIGTDELVIEGVRRLHGTIHRVMPDRIEAGTYAIAAVIAGGEVELVGAVRENIAALIALLEKSGAGVTDTPRGLKVAMNGRRRSWR